MATYSTRNRLVKQATNENPNTWGTTLNGGMIDMIDEASDGITALALTGDVTLTDEDGATDQARKRVLNITSSDQHARVITIPAVEKWYIVENESAYRVNIKTASGAAAIVPGQCSAIVKCDGTDCTKLMQPSWGIISTTSPTSGATSTITLTGFNCTDFMLVFNGLAPDSSNHINVAFSSDNSVWTAANLFSGTDATFPYYGAITIPNATAPAGLVSLVVDANMGSNNTVNVSASGVITSQMWAWRLSGGIGYVRLTLTSGSSPVFSTGSVVLYGR